MIIISKLAKVRMGEVMKPSVALQAHREEARRIVLGHRVRNPRIFGSVLHGNDTDDSDLDLLVDPTPDTTLMDIGAIRFELRKLLGVPVDVLTPKALPDGFRDRVIEEARPI
jgi:predicted nucleotidyltransferase